MTIRNRTIAPKIAALAAGMRAAIAGIALAIPGVALAQSRDHAPSLPGVEEGYRIVDEDALTRSVEPEPNTIPNGPGTFRVGNWDVTISGFVSFEVGTGVPREGR